MENFFELNNLEQFCTENPGSIAFAFLALEKINVGDLESALNIAEQGSRQHPTYAFGHYVLALCYYHSNDYTKAKTHLELAVAYDEKNPRAWKLLSEINQKLDLPLLAEDGNLQYFLLDPFNSDAVNQFRQADIDQFNAFENGQEISLENEFEDIVDMPEGTPAAPAVDMPDPEESIAELFEDMPDPEPESDISQKVDEVFKETMGDMSLDREEFSNLESDEAAQESFFEDIFSEDNEPTEIQAEAESPTTPPTESLFEDTFAAESPAAPPEESLFDDTFAAESPAAPAEESFFDDTFANIEIDETDLAPENPTATSLDDTIGFNTEDFANTDDVTPSGKETEAKDFEAIGDFAAEENVFGGIDDIADEEVVEEDGLDINAELDDFFSDYDIEETPEEDVVEDVDQINFGNILFDDSVVNEVTPGTTPEIEEETLMDYNAMVDDIIAENNEEQTIISAAEIFENNDVEEETDIPIPEMPEAPPAASEDVSVSLNADVLDKNENGSEGGESSFRPSATRFGRPPLLTPTLGEIYISQGRYEEAVEVFEQLLEQNPDNRRYQKKIQDIKKIIAKKQDI